MSDTYQKSNKSSFGTHFSKLYYWNKIEHLIIGPHSFANIDNYFQLDGYDR